MKLNVAFPATGGQKVIDITDEHRIAQFVEKKIAQEIDGSVLGDDFKGYVFRISGGNDKQGFPMKQGILTTNRVRIMLKKGDKCFRERKSGERKRKSIRGCIVSRDICMLDLVIVKKGPKEIPGVTDVRKARRVGPKRAGKIRKLFGLTKTADVRKYVVRQKVTNKKGKEKSKAPKIQRLITPLRLKRKKALEQKKIKSATRTHENLAAYKKLLQGRQKAEREVQLQAARLKKEKKQKKEEAKKAQGKKKVTTPAAAAKAKDKTPVVAAKAKGKAPAAATAGGKAKTAAAPAKGAKGKATAPVAKGKDKGKAAPAVAGTKGKTPASPAKKADTGKGKTDAAKGKADTAKGKAGAAKGKADTAKGKTETAKGKTEPAKGKTDTVKGKTDTTKGKTNTQAKAKASAGSTAKADAAKGKKK